MNPWAWTGRNPYFETAFQVLDLDPAADRATARTRIGARRKRISYDAERFPLFGTTLSAADVNDAEERIATLSGRIAAELITHPTEAEGADLASLAELMGLCREWSERGAGGAGVRRDTASWLDTSVLPELLPAPGPVQHTAEGATA
ncbi:hypothetical protein [Pseudonocardia sp. TRM90224]|uniref:hypothetical protein n=1 Tax=Pseudonocardia sp. TRM90224 TaxID=2812678 RepID=UPI001E39B551|nr:hypothetical protein [Pseudonocardia sp. TRM90224]